MGKESVKSGRKPGNRGDRTDKLDKSGVVGLVCFANRDLTFTLDLSKHEAIKKETFVPWKLISSCFRHKPDFIFETIVPKVNENHRLSHMLSCFAS